MSNNKQETETVSNNKQETETVSNNKQETETVSNNKQETLIMIYGMIWRGIHGFLSIIITLSS